MTSLIKKNFFWANFSPRWSVQPNVPHMATQRAPTVGYVGAATNIFFNLIILLNYIIQPDMVQHKSVIYLPLSLHGQIIHLREEMITPRPKVEKAAQRAPLSPTTIQKS